MKMADVVIGNSSSGIVEAPAVKVPTVNIGPRQDGRLKASSIIDCAEVTDEIIAAIRKALSSTFRQTLAETVSVYGDCGASAAIKDILVSEPLPDTLKKKFHDI